MRKEMAIAGSVALSVGVFMPVVETFLGRVNFIQMSRGLGILTLLLALVTAASAVREKYMPLWVPGCASAALIFYGFVSVSAQSIPLEAMAYGWAVLSVGAFLIIGSAANLKLIGKRDSQNHSAQSRDAAKFCSQCGARNSPGDLFCKECGAKFA